jgi:hypothetical protein
MINYQNKFYNLIINSILLINKIKKLKNKISPSMKKKINSFKKSIISKIMSTN